MPDPHLLPLRALQTESGRATRCVPRSTLARRTAPGVQQRLQHERADATRDPLQGPLRYGDSPLQDVHLGHRPGDDENVKVDHPPYPRDGHSVPLQSDCTGKQNHRLRRD